MNDDTNDSKGDSTQDLSAWTPPEGYTITDPDQRSIDITLAMVVGKVERVGPTQRDLLVAARGEPLMLDRVSRDNRRWCSLKRLIKRGLISKHRFGALHLGFTTIYAATERGRSVWLLVDPSREKNKGQAETT